MRKKTSLVVLLSISVFILAGCSSIDQEQAEAIAQDFVKANVKFFSREEENITDVPLYEVNRITSYKEGSNWVVVIQITSEVEGEDKTNDLVVEINNKGKAVKFNGQPVPKY